MHGTQDGSQRGYCWQIEPARIKQDTTQRHGNEGGVGGSLGGQNGFFRNTQSSIAGWEVCVLRTSAQSAARHLADLGVTSYLWSVSTHRGIGWGLYMQCVSAGWILEKRYTTMP